MSSSNTYTTIGNWSTGLTLSPEKAERPAPTPRELIATRAVQTKGGWLGQVIIDSEIVWESDPVDVEDPPVDESAQQVALSLANTYVVSRVKALFDPSFPEE